MTLVALDGAIVLLEEQDRSAWNWSDVREGMAWLARSAAGDELTRYHVEAGIAWEHCRMPTFADTDWRRIAELYDTLDRIAPSPLNSLNRAVAEAYLHGPQAGLDRLAAVPPESVPDRYPGWHTVIGELHFRLGRHSDAERAWREALAGPRPAPIENSCVAASPSASPMEASPAPRKTPDRAIQDPVTKKPWIGLLLPDRAPWLKWHVLWQFGQQLTAGDRVGKDGAPTRSPRPAEGSSQFDRFCRRRRRDLAEFENATNEPICHFGRRCRGTGIAESPISAILAGGRRWPAGTVDGDPVTR